MRTISDKELEELSVTCHLSSGPDVYISYNPVTDKFSARFYNYPQFPEEVDNELIFTYKTGEFFKYQTYEGVDVVLKKRVKEAINNYFISKRNGRINDILD